MFYLEPIEALRREAKREAERRFPDAPRREAWIFAEILRRIPVYRAATVDRLAGDYGAAEWPPSPPQPPQPEDHREEAAPYCRAGFSPAHTTLDYPRALRLGLSGLIAGLPADGGDYVEAERMALRAVAAFARRYRALGFELCRRTPEEPAETFAEALQALWLLHTVTGVAERSYASLSLGCFDQYLYPFFRRDLDRGVPREELAALLEEFFAKLNRYGDAACALNLGGGGFNELTRLVIEVAAAAGRPAPLLALRWQEELSDADFRAALRPELLTIGQPTVYGEANCRRTLARRGVPPEDIDRWAVNSCMGLTVAGCEFSDMWAVVFNCLIPLGSALAEASAGSIAELTAAAQEQAEILLKRLLDRHDALIDEEIRLRPVPYTSAMLNGEPGRDRLDGGARYLTGNVDFFGLANAADALHALDRVVFRERVCSLRDAAAACRRNWSAPGDEALRRRLLAVPKFGNGDAGADRTAAQLADAMAALVRRLGSGRRMTYLASFHTLNLHVDAGLQTPASCDGRFAGEALAKNLGPAAERSLDGLTGLIRSAAAVDQSAFPGGQALDLHLDRALYASAEGLDKFAEAARGYFRLGGLQLQINAVDVEALEQAMAEPEKWSGLQVRIGGFSMRFVELNPAVQREMIARFRRGA